MLFRGGGNFEVIPLPKRVKSEVLYIMKVVNISSGQGGKYYNTTFKRHCPFLNQFISLQNLIDVPSV